MVKEAQIVVPTKSGDYSIKWNGYNYSISTPDDKALLKYPTSLAKALHHILVEEAIENSSDKEILDLKSYAKYIDERLEEIKNMRLQEYEDELKSNPLKSKRGRRPQAVNQEQESEDIPEIEFDDEDDI